MGNYQKRINSPIITTGNELVKQQIADFSRRLNLQELYIACSFSYNLLIFYIEKVADISSSPTLK